MIGSQLSEGKLWVQRPDLFFRRLPQERREVDETYRGYTIRVTRNVRWDAILVDMATGTVLPTKATALMREGRTIAIDRARALIDIYAKAAETRRERAA